MYHDFAVQNFSSASAQYRSLARQAASRAHNCPMLEDLGLMEIGDGNLAAATSYFGEARSCYSNRDDILRVVIEKADAWSKLPRATVKAGLTNPDYVVEITMVAVKDASRKAFTTPNADGTAGTANANLSSAIQVGNRLYVAGILGNTPANKGDVKAQTTELLARVGRTLKAAGFDWAHVVDGVVYLPDMTKFPDMNAAYREVFTKDFPARATLGTGLMGDGLVEIMFIAVK